MIIADKDTKPLPSTRWRWGIIAGLILVMGLITSLMILANWSRDTDQPMIVVPVNPTVRSLEERLATQQTAYQAQLTTLQESRQTQEAAYQTELATLSQQVSTAQAELAALEAQKQNLDAKLDRLETIHTERLRAYEAQQQQMQQQHQARERQLRNQLQAVRQNLAEVQSQLKP